MESLVTPEWLEGALGETGVRVADASWFLPEHGRDAAAEFAAGHIPGAVFLDLDSLSDIGNPLPSMRPSQARFAARMAALGLGDDMRIILYDDSPLHSAARAWWLMRSFGMRDVAILDGGLARWKAERRPLESGDSAPEPHVLTPRPDTHGLRDLEAMLANLATRGEQVVDARSPARFAGAEPEPRPGVVPGHIPGATNIHYTRFFDAEGNWKRGAALHAVFADAGIDPARPMVATCGSGVTAAVIVFAAHLLGHDAALYDGSWAEWGGNPATPKAKGTA